MGKRQHTLKKHSTMKKSQNRGVLLSMKEITVENVHVKYPEIMIIPCYLVDLGKQGGHKALTVVINCDLENSACSLFQDLPIFICKLNLIGPFKKGHIACSIFLYFNFGPDSNWPSYL